MTHIGHDIIEDIYSHHKSTYYSSNLQQVCYVVLKTEEKIQLVNSREACACGGKKNYFY